MRISTFVPAIMAFTLFTATTQALPAFDHHERAVELLKRGGSSTTTTTNLIDVVVDLFIKAETKILIDACVSLKAEVCADVDVSLTAKTKVLGGLLETEVEVKELEVKAKAAVDADIKARVDAALKVEVIAKIDAHVRGVVLKICPKADKACLKKNAHNIVAKVAAKINLDVKKLAAKIKADLHVHVKARLDLYIKKLDLNALGLLNVSITAVAKVRASVNVHIKAFLEICAKLLVSVKLVADIRAL